MNSPPQEEDDGYNVTKIEAYDTDPGAAGELEYGFVTNDALNRDHSKFYIDPNTGAITVSGRLDREAQENYEVRNLAS